MEITRMISAKVYLKAQNLKELDCSLSYQNIRQNLKSTRIEGRGKHSFSESLLKQHSEAGTQSFSSDPLLYWKEVPRSLNPLNNLAKKVIGCTATSAPSERVFSITENYFTANRVQLGVSSLRLMIMIKCNSELYEKLLAI